VAQPPAAPPTVILPHPQSAIQAGIAVAHDAVGSLGAQPVLLLIVLINVVFIGVGGFFLAKLEGTRSSLMLSTLDIIKACVLETAPLGANAERIRKLEEALIEERANEKAGAPGAP
jgi:predicted permease